MKGLQIGYRHIDTAALYRNEEAVGKAIKDSGVPRDQIFLVSKIRKSDILAARIKEAVAESLEKLGEIDLLLLHAPTANYLNAWREMTEIERTFPEIHCVGVSNFQIHQLVKLKPKPKYNQIECTPFLPRRELCEYCLKENIMVCAHSPLTKGIKLDNPMLKSIAETHRVTPAQIMLSWCVCNQMIAVVRTTNLTHLRENMCIVELSDEDMHMLASLDECFSTHPEHL